MYCGICVEVCPFDALFWSPEFEYATHDMDELVHEKERLEEWTYTVLPPPALEVGATAAEEPAPRTLRLPKWEPRDMTAQEYAFCVMAVIGDWHRSAS